MNTLTTPPAVIEKKTIGFIGRCPVKGCACIIRLDIPTRAIVKTRPVRYVGQTPEKYTIWDAAYSPHNYLIHCAKHRYQIGFREIEGTFSDVHTCDARCMSAKGPNCDCSCGGANHGGAYQVKLNCQ